MSLTTSTTFQSYNQRLVLRKGVLFDDEDPDFKPITLYSWDVVPFCQFTKCPAFKYCDYNKGIDIKCAAHITYMKHVLQILVFNNPMIDDMVVFRIGSELMPLYSMLFTFFLNQLGVEDSFWIKNNKPYVHPVYKEIRETIKLISTARQKMGIPDSLNVNTSPKQIFGGGSPGNDHGNPEALKKMRRRRQ